MFTYLIALITLVISPKRLFAVLLGVGVVGYAVKQYQDQQAPYTPNLSPTYVPPEDWYRDVVFVKRVDKLKAAHYPVPPLMQTRYDKIKEEWSTEITKASQRR